MTGYNCKKNICILILSMKIHFVVANIADPDEMPQKYMFCIIFMKIHFVLANSADLDEMPYYAAFHLGLHCS